MIQYHPFDLLFVSSPVVSGTFHSLGQGGLRGMHKDKIMDYTRAAGKSCMLFTAQALA